MERPAWSADVPVCERQVDQVVRGVGRVRQRVRGGGGDCAAADSTIKDTVKDRAMIDKEGVVGCACCTINDSRGEYMKITQVF